MMRVDVIYNIMGQPSKRVVHWYNTLVDRSYTPGDSEEWYKYIITCTTGGIALPQLFSQW
jgi:hypothetical protein